MKLMPINDIRRGTVWINPARVGTVSHDPREEATRITILGEEPIFTKDGVDTTVIELRKYTV